MDGFWDLTVENQIKVLNYEDNFVGLSAPANESKGSKSFEEWTRYEKGKVDVDPEFREKMMEQEKKLRPRLQQYIHQLLGEQRAQ